MNNFTFTGHLGGDAEIRYLQNGTAVTSFGVAATVGYGEKKKTQWVRCGMFGDRGVGLASYLVKGQLVAVSGEASLNTYHSKELGKEVSQLQCRVNDVSLLGGRPQQGQDQAPRQQDQALQQQNHYPPQGGQQGNNQAQNQGGQQNQSKFEDDDIPF